MKWDFNKFAIDYLPTIFKQTQVVLNEWIKLLIADIDIQYKQSLDRHEIDLFDVQHTGQVASLEHFLNIKLNVTGKRILIIDTPNLPKHFIATDVEALRTLLDTFDYEGTTYNYDPSVLWYANDDITPTVSTSIWLSTDAYLDIDEVDFIVQVDLNNYNDSLFMEKLIFYINKFRTAGTTYTIESY